MAKISGTQSIPAECKTQYDGAITPSTPDNIVRNRYPWRKPGKQLNGSHVTTLEKAQRTRWIESVAKFKKQDSATRARWYSARPISPAPLYYYNYFILSSLKGNVEVNGLGGGVIKDINHYTFAMTGGQTAPVTIAVDTVDPSKAICFFFGAGWAEVGSGVGVAVYPYLISMNSTQLIVNCSMTPAESAQFGVSLIEYI